MGLCKTVAVLCGAVILCCVPVMAATDSYDMVDPFPEQIEEVEVSIIIIPSEEEEEIVEAETEPETLAPVPSYSASDLRYMASIIYAEANDQCYAGQQAVGIVVMNRSESSQFANGVYNVIYQKGQFTPVSNGSMQKALNLYDSGKMMSSCIEAAKYALEGNKTVYYNGQTLDMSPYLFFATKMTNGKLRIDGHSFR